MRTLRAGSRSLAAALLLIFGPGCGGNDATEPPPVCSYAIAPATSAFTADGGPASLTVTTSAGCGWNAAAGAPWITINSGASGSGPGTVAYTVAAHAASVPRSGSLDVAGQTHTVTQQGRPATVCSYAIAPARADFRKDAATGTFNVTAQDGCAWTATTSASWITITAGQGSGNGAVAFAVARNDGVGDRTATIAVADRTFTVEQSGDPGGCQYAVAPVEVRPCMPAGAVAVNLQTQENCPWTVSPDAPWLGVTGSGSRSGSDVITITYTDNYDAPRQGIVQVRWPTPTAGQNIVVLQAGCLYSVSQDAFSMAAAGGIGTFTVYQMAEPNSCGGPLQDQCVWQAVSDASWIKITSSMPRTGDNPVSFTVDPNPSSTARAGRIAVRDKVVVISQSGA